MAHSFSLWSAKCSSPVAWQVACRNMTLIHCDLLTNSQFSHWLQGERERRRDPFVSCFTLAVSWPSISLDQEESPWQHINVCCLLESCLPALILHILNVRFLLNGEVKDCIFSHSLKETKHRMVVRWGNDSY